MNEPDRVDHIVQANWMCMQSGNLLEFAHILLNCPWVRFPLIASLSLLTSTSGALGAVVRDRLPLLVSIYSGNRKSPATLQSKPLRREEICGSATRWSRDRPQVAPVTNSSGGSNFSFWLSSKAKHHTSMVTTANCLDLMFLRQIPVLTECLLFLYRIGGDTRRALTDHFSCNLAADQTLKVQCSGTSGPQSHYKQTNCKLATNNTSLTL